MTNITKLLNRYMYLQGTCFPSGHSLCYFTDFENRSVKEILKEYGLIDKINFGVILVFKTYKVVIVSEKHTITGFTLYDRCSTEISFSSDLMYVIFVCQSCKLCFWSSDLSQLVRHIKLVGAESLLLEMYSYEMERDLYPCDYAIVPAILATDAERFETFKDYVLLDPLGYHTKDSDFLFKDAFNGFGRKKYKDISLVHYFERVYTDFVYGYLDLSLLNDDDTELVIFNFWFKDLLRLCDLGVSHRGYCEFGPLSKFYFVLACKNREDTVANLRVLQKKYNVVIMDYEKLPTSFVGEFMHYEAEEAFFNNYFIGIFNRESWVLFDDVFAKIKARVNADMSRAYGSHTVNDIYTIERKYHFRFASFRYRTATYRSEQEESFHLNDVPWIALPDALVELRQRKSSEKKICDV